MTVIKPTWRQMLLPRSLGELLAAHHTRLLRKSAMTPLSNIATISPRGTGTRKMHEEHGTATTHDKRLSVLLCEDMPQFSEKFVKDQAHHFRIQVCEDIGALEDVLWDMNESGTLPDVLLLDLFSRRGEVPHDSEFERLRGEVDSEVKDICRRLTETNDKARKILDAHGIDLLSHLREEFPEYRLPILLYSRLGPYLLHPKEAATVDQCNCEFLLKWLPPTEQRRKINRFYRKWRSATRPIPLEISRKLSTLPTPIADAVADHLKAGKFKSAVTDGCFAVTQRLREVCGSSRDGGALAYHARDFLLLNGRRKAEENDNQFASRVRAVCDLYKGTYVILRNKILHDHYTPDEWRYADACLSMYSLIWIGLDDLT